jgi:type IV pilus assembly protein PilA
MHTSKGFTLIELMIVIAILGLLMAIAIPAYQDYTVRSKITEGMNLAAPIKVGVVEHFHATGGDLPNSNSAAGVPSASTFDTEFVDSIEVGTPANGDITISYNNSSSGIPELGSDNILSLTPVTSEGLVDWHCGVGRGSTNIEPKYLPASCR